jgi:dTDP-4-dehydrorhamnose 3,5-epimerase-like enzyme
MKLIDVKTLAIEAVKVIRFARFNDYRGYFTELYRRSDFRTSGQVLFLNDVDLV